MARADELSRGLVPYLRHALGAPALDLDGALEPLGGGFDTEIHAFRLRVAPPGFAGPLVLRLLRPHHDPAMVTREQATQNALAAQGYPAPRVLLASLDPAPLGAAFAIMERAPGVPLLSRVVGMAGVLVDAQARLHALDPGPLRVRCRISTAISPRSAGAWRPRRSAGWRRSSPGCARVGRRPATSSSATATSIPRTSWSTAPR